MSGSGGRRFGRYQLARPLTSDAISTTWLATAATGGGRGAREPSRFTVRIIEQRPQPGDAHGDELIRRFLADVSRASAIDHPAILRPVDSGTIEGRPFVATPFARAVPLRDMLTHDGAITQSAALAIFAQLAAGLDAAHRAGVTHGAISPQTIWIGPGSGRGVAYVGYLTGFGTDVLLREHLARTPRGAPIDDVLYVAPEQLRGEAPTPESDQYALAGAMFHTLASAPPFERETRSKLYGAHLMASPPDLTDHDHAAPASVTAALRRGLAKQPRERFPSCGALVNAALPAAPADARGTASRGPASTGGRSPAGVGAAAAAAGAGRRRPKRGDGRGDGRAGGVHRQRTGPSGRPPWWLVVAGVGVLLAVIALWTLLRDPSGSSPAAARGAVSAATTAGPTRTTSLRPTEAAAVEPGWSAKVADAAIATLDTAGGTIVAVDRTGGLAGVGSGAGQVRWRVDTAGRTGGDGVAGASEADDGGSGGAIASAGGSLVAGGDRLTAYDVRSGTQRWTADGPTRSLSILDDTVIGVTSGPEGPEVLAVSLSDGVEAWHIHGSTELAAEPLTVASAGNRAYALRGQQLMAIDPTAATQTAMGRQQVTGPTWRVELTGARQSLAQTSAGVAVAHDDGQVCGHAAADGAMQWCEPVPGAQAAMPRLFAVAGGIVVATPEAVVALDRRSGAPRWSVSPGATGPLVAASNRAVVVADGQGGVTALDPREGDELLAIDDAGEVTAVTTRNAKVVVATGDGTLRAFDLPSGG